MAVVKKAPQFQKNSNNIAAPAEPQPSMAYRYERAYQSLLKAETEGMQRRILAVKDNPLTRDSQVNEFIVKVIELAESDREL